MIRVIKTIRSTYEVDIDNKKIRRLNGERVPTQRQGTDGEWKAYEEITQAAIGVPFITVWRTEDGVMKSTMSSPVTEVSETFNDTN